MSLSGIAWQCQNIPKYLQFFLSHSMYFHFMLLVCEQNTKKIYTKTQKRNYKNLIVKWIVFTTLSSLLTENYASSFTCWIYIRMTFFSFVIFFRMLFFLGPECKTFVRGKVCDMSSSYTFRSQMMATTKVFLEKMVFV